MRVRRGFVRFSVIALLVAVTMYFGLYLTFAERSPKYFGNRLRQIGATQEPPDTYFPSYSGAGDWAENFFAPAHWVDRCLRPGYWPPYDRNRLNSC
jgi:hypothetical protein